MRSFLRLLLPDFLWKRIVSGALKRCVKTVTVEFWCAAAIGSVLHSDIKR
jgi:hypothetical protein